MYIGLIDKADVPLTPSWTTFATIDPTEAGPALWEMQLKLAPFGPMLDPGTGNPLPGKRIPTWVHLGFVRVGDPLGGTGHGVHAVPADWPVDDELVFTQSWFFKAEPGVKVKFRVRHNGRSVTRSLWQAKVTNELRPLPAA